MSGTKPTTPAELAARLQLSESQLRSAVFWIVDYLMDNISHDAVDCGAYHNSPMNGDRRMIDSYKAILWAQYEEIDGQKPKTAGPWVAIDVGGISIHSERPYYVLAEVKPRLAFQRPTDVHVFGYTADHRDIERATALRSNYPELTIWTPLIDAGITKAGTLAMVEQAGIALPKPYLLGFHNNNCKTCVKATSPDYWSLVRKSYPDDFARMVELSRRKNVRLARINDERIFIDEIPADWPTTNPIAPACDFLCHIAEQDLEAA